MNKMNICVGDYVKIKKQKVNPRNIDFSKWYQVKVIRIFNNKTILESIFEINGMKEVLGYELHQIKEVMKLESIEEK